MGEITAKVLIVGGGPGGYVAAIRAGQLGLDTVLVEQGAKRARRHLPQCRLHSVQGADPCRRGFQPRASSRRRRRRSASRSSARRIDFARTIEWKDGIVGRLTSGVGALLKRPRSRSSTATATMLDGKTCRVETDTGPQTIRAEHVVLATGSEAVPLPALPFGGRVISSTEALSLPAVPERLVVVGAGYIGLELGTAFAKLGAKVTVIEAEDRILPLYDAELTRPVATRLQALGVEILTGARATGLSDAGDALLVEQQAVGRAASRPTSSSSPSAAGRASPGSGSNGSI